MKANDALAKDDDSRTTKLSEVDGLRLRHIWKAVRETDIPKNANVMGGKFLLSLKNFDTPEEKAKVRYFAQGFSDRVKPYMVHDVSTFRISSIRMVMSIAATMGFRLFSHDVTQAYLQSKSHMTRDVYIRPKKDGRKILGLNDGQFFKILKPLYGLCDVRDYWGQTMESHLMNDLKMDQSDGDSAMYVWIHDGRLSGITGMYVDYLLIAGNVAFQKHTEKTLKHFESKPRVYDRFDFYGAQIASHDDGSTTMTQEYYVRTMKPADKKGTYQNFRKERAFFSCLTSTRPDGACIANRAAQVTEKNYSLAKVNELNKGIRMIMKSPSIGLKYKKLHVDSKHIRVYADASYATSDDLTSQLGYLILLHDRYHNCHILEYASRKSRRVVRSIMGSEVYAFMDAFDLAVVVRKDLEMMMGTNLEITMWTDCKQLFDAVTC